MKERPILFSGPMVRAILDGRKTQTRRVVKGEALRWLSPEVGFAPTFVANPENSLCPYGGPGDRLWVRETHYVESAGYEDGTGRRIFYRASDGDAPISLWRPSIFMPRWASRLTLEVTAVRVERVQDISGEDAKAEGCDASGCWEHDHDPEDLGCLDSRVPTYRALWDSINGKRPGCAWADNPWVWVIAFRRLP